MSSLEFLSPACARAEAGFEPRPRSPLAGALPGGGASGIEDISLTVGKLEVRGEVAAIDVDAEVVRLTPERALVLCSSERTAAIEAELRESFGAVIDVTGALAGLRLRSPTLMRRLTELELDRLPAVGAVARVRTLVTRDAEGFRLFFPQEYGEYMARTILDTARGLP